MRASDSNAVSLNRAGERGGMGFMVDRTAGAPGQGLDLCIELGRAYVRRDEAEKLGRGAVVSLESLVDEPVDIRVGGQLIARGEVLVLDGSFCIRVTKLIAPSRVA